MPLADREVSVRAATAQTPTIPGLEMLNDAMNNLQIDLFKGPEGFINFALSAEFDEHLLLPWPGRPIWEELVE